MSATRIDLSLCRAEGRRPRRASDVRYGRRSRLQHSLAILKALPGAGADVIELGMPFTDPMADGAAIQAAGLRAFKSGQNMKRTLALVREFRATDGTTPIILMGYYNPIYVYGIDKFSG